MYLIAGLGNPGLKYRKTKHNTGFMAIDYYADKKGADFKKTKFSALVAETKVGNTKCILVKPQTFMNNSGEAIRALSDFYKIPTSNIIIIFDDVSLKPGKVRIRKSGSAGGHNGIKSIISHLKTDEFSRIKIGVGEKLNPEQDLADFVLSKYSKEDLKKTTDTFEDVSKGIELIVKGKIDEAMNKIN